MLHALRQAEVDELPVGVGGGGGFLRKTSKLGFSLVFRV